MLRSELYKKASTPMIKIKLPQSNKIEEIKQQEIVKNRTDNLVEITNFSGDSIASTPPDGYFMHNLRLRMGKN